MTARVQKWGNSLAVRIPKSFATEVGIKEGVKVEVTLEDSRIVVTAAAPQPKYTLEELLAGVTKKNRHPEFDTGRPVGKEIW